ncbi:MAG TPA: 2'-deoxycytidine 5'-triphosphate deaminase [Candidatus Paceibacterota bacterium]|nr:2'-deoxycytidine 5'-triphosphate deaminase [Candidatus Paceibacterota bacterium]
MGVLPSQDLRALLRQGLFPAIEEQWVNPASIDVPVTDEIYRMRYVMKPGEHDDVLSLVHQYGERIYSRKHEYLLDVGVPYLVRVGRCVLPEGVYAYANPKSTTGRLNVLVRVVADRVPKFDALEPAGWQGDVWMYVQPQSFPIRVRPGVTLTQLRLIDGQSFVSETLMGRMHARADGGLFFDADGGRLPYPYGLVRSHADKLHMTLFAQTGHVGWVCDGGLQPLDLSCAQGSVDARSYFRPLYARGGTIELVPGRFYILTTNEYLRVPSAYAAELRPVDPRIGEFRVHAAGFVDPGWGGARGAPITLEVTLPDRSPLLVRHGEIIARVRFERMKRVPDMRYGASIGSHYGEQRTARLAKYFREAA